MPGWLKIWTRRLRRVARALRHTPDRLLHGARRRSGAAALSGGSAIRVLFVCHGNICRSPYAAESFRRRLNGRRVQVASAGFVGPGRPVPEYGRLVAQRRGIDLSEHRSQLLTPELVGEAELIVVMDATQRRAIAQRFDRARSIVLLGDFDPLRIDTRAVRDPYNQPESVFEEVYERIDRCLQTLVRLLPPDAA